MTGERRQRRDAVANRARIIEAAAQVLREEGMGADMRQIAAASGVGIGTLYRHFPTRDDLVHAVTGTDLAALANAGLSADKTAADALREFFTGAIAQLVDNRAMVDVLTGGSPADEDVQRCIAHLTRVGQDAVDRARHDHSLAADVTASDIAYQLMGLARVAQLLPDPSPSTVTRHVELALRGLIASDVAVSSRPATTST
ncbi:TetR/AcrR family transcriptional regulator [Phytohabitans kaempferiae]|uniref:TetR/AcrR family transcriptional regulator n=1 Tax=Phytohabitans kaempferiae TaxID=1620943 RepID=A0ABV6M5W4_9ACTN